MILPASNSEAASKKRGRPRLFSRDLVRDSGPPWLKSDRQRQTWVRSSLAVRCIVQDDVPVDGVEQLINLDNNTLRVSVLEQLGRYQLETGCDDAEVVDLARQLNAMFRDDPTMTVRRAAKLMRVVRANARRKGADA